MQDRFSSFELLLSCFGVSSLAGIAQVVRRGEPIELRKIVGAGLYSGIIGLLVAMLLHNYVGDANYILLIGVSGLAGLGGSNVLDFILTAWSGGGISITIAPKREGKDKSRDQGEGTP